MPSEPAATEIHAVATFPNIAAEDVAEFKRLVAEAVSAAGDEPGTLRYDWYFDGGDGRCVVLETYASSDAVMHHLTNPRNAVIRRLVELGGGFELAVFGSPSRAVIEALARVQPTLYSFGDGKPRGGAGAPSTG